jgi:hypothetical protein
MSTILGIDPGPLVVNLTVGADFTAQLTYEVNGVVTSWPASTVLTLVFDNGTVFTATIVTSAATFDVDKATVATMPKAQDVKLVYTNGSTDRVLLLGRALRRG